MRTSCLSLLSAGRTGGGQTLTLSMCCGEQPLGQLRLPGHPRRVKEKLTPTVSCTVSPGLSESLLWGTETHQPPKVFNGAPFRGDSRHIQPHLIFEIATQEEICSFNSLCPHSDKELIEKGRILPGEKGGPQQPLSSCCN